MLILTHLMLNCLIHWNLSIYIYTYLDMQLYIYIYIKMSCYRGKKAYFTLYLNYTFRCCINGSSVWLCRHAFNIFLPLVLSILSSFMVTYWSDITGGGGGVVVTEVSAMARLPHPYAWPPAPSQHVLAEPKLPLSTLTTDRPQPPYPSDIGSWVYG